jgi:hypothetical protein
MKGLTLYWLLVIAAWVATMLLLEEITGDGVAQAWIAAGASVATGIAIGRWWLLGVPVVGMMAVSIYAVIADTGDCATCSDDVSVVGWIGIAVIYIVIADVGLGAGVAMRRMAIAGWARLAPRS